MQNLQEQFTKTVGPALRKQFGYDNLHDTPTILKVTLNAGLGKGKDAKFADVVVDTVRRITGQQPVRTKAKKSIAGFKVREGMVVGVMATLRGPRMWDFLTKLTNIAFARVRDFRGIPESAVDSQGNFNYGFTEHIAFPEIRPDEVETLHGLQVTITTTAKNHDEGIALLKALGFPFVSKEQK
ncbi:MAG: 50S ribosomal protein L5 [Patescibacteria group bacterium]